MSATIKLTWKHLSGISQNEPDEYCSTLEGVIHGDFHSYWADKPWEPDEIGQLRQISELRRQEDDGQLKVEFEEIIRKGAERLFREAQTKLQAVLTT